MSLVVITLHPVFMPISRLDTGHLFFLLIAQLSLCSQVGLGELHHEYPRLYLGIISIVMKIIVVFVQLAPPCTFVSTLCVLISMRILLAVIYHRGSCLMQLFVSRSVPCLPDILLTEDWVETGNHDVLGVLSQRLGEYSLVSL